MRVQLNPEIKERYKNRCVGNFEIQTEYEKTRYEENSEHHENIKRLRTFFNKKITFPITLAKCIMEDSINAVSDYLSMKIIRILKHHPVKSFDEKLCIGETRHKYLYKK